MKTIERAVEFLSRVAVTIAGFVILVMAFVTTYGVFQRYVLKDPEYYTVEISLMCMVWGFVLAAAYVERKDQQIRNDLLSNALPKKAQIFLVQVFSPLAGIVFAGTITWRSWINAFYSLRIGETSFATLWGVPLFPIKITVPVGYGLLCLVLLAKLLKGIVLLFSRPGKREAAGGLARAE